jgi:sulfoxide reductase heme-binding subunit YedZ
MNAGLLLWMLARVAGLTSYAALALAVVGGIALRTGALDSLAANRAVKSAHEFAGLLWLPLGLLHVVALVLDPTAHIRPVDLVVPFANLYLGSARLAVGLGTLSLDLLALVVITAWARTAFGRRAWTWLHRLAYPAFAAVFAHAVLAGTDFSDPAVSAITWSAAAAIAVLAVARMRGRLA